MLCDNGSLAVSRRRNDVAYEQALSVGLFWRTDQRLGQSHLLISWKRKDGGSQTSQGDTVITKHFRRLLLYWSLVYVLS